jgi:hypothetical protein
MCTWKSYCDVRSFNSSICGLIHGMCLNDWVPVLKLCCGWWLTACCGINYTHTWIPNNNSASQKSPCLLRKQSTNCQVYNSWSLKLTLSSVNLISTIRPYYVKTNFDINLLSLFVTPNTVLDTLPYDSYFPKVLFLLVIWLLFDLVLVESVSSFSLLQTTEL